MAEGPFHSHERFVQKTFQVEDEALELGLAMVLPEITPPVVPLLQSQPFIVVSFVDVERKSNYPAWTTILHGNRGFFTVSDRKTIVVREAHCGEGETGTLSRILHEANTNDKIVPMAVMVIDFQSRRRFRINGYADRIALNDASRFLSINFDFHVAEAFVNCPKYIQSRKIIPLKDSKHAPISRSEGTTNRSVTYLTNREASVIHQCDTFFLTSYYQSDPISSPNALKYVKVDITHRGGLPGFVRILDEHSLLWPEYAGNNMYMTLGNIHGNQKVGLLFLDFERNQCLQLSGNAELLLSPPAGCGPMDAAEKYVRFTIVEPIHYIQNVFPFSFELIDNSPYNPKLSGFQGKVDLLSKGVSSSKLESKEETKENSNKSTHLDKNIQLKKVTVWNESEASFFFSIPLSKKALRYLPGQYVMIKFNIPEISFEGMRSWTITSISSSRDHEAHFEITIKRAALVTNWLFDQFISLAGSSMDIQRKWKELIDSRRLQAEFVAVQGDFTIFQFHEYIPKKEEIIMKTIDTSFKSSHLLFFSGGIGMTPFIGMIKQLALFSSYPESVHVHWFLSVRQANELNVLSNLSNFIEENVSNLIDLKHISVDIHINLTDERSNSARDKVHDYHPDTLNSFYGLPTSFIRIVSIEIGRIQRDDISYVLRKDNISPSKTEIYLCGPQGFMNTVTSYFPEYFLEKIHTEDFYF